MHTKVTPGAIDLPTPTGLGLSYDKVTASCDLSFEQLGVPQIDIFYLHSVPTESQENTTALEETLRAVNDLYKRGLFHRFGVSSFPAWGVMQVYYKCKELGYVLPSVCESSPAPPCLSLSLGSLMSNFCVWPRATDQGMYNPLNRQVEQEVFPCLKLLGMHFYAFSPLAAGMLATSGGRSSSRMLDDKPSDPATGRSDEPQVMREAKSGIVAACEVHGLDLSQATLRWMLNHSMLGQGDGLISGVGSLGQLQENLSALSVESGPLPAQVLAAFEHGWNKVVAGPPGYPARHWFPVARL